MELATQLSLRNLDLNLEWRRRTFNREADALSNEDFAAFDAARRVDVSGYSREFLVMNSLLAEGGSFLSDVNRLREERRMAASKGLGRKRGRGGQTLRLTDPW